MSEDAEEVQPRQGWRPALVRESERLEALEHAFDYRGDVTLRLTDGRTIEGYLFDRRVGSTLAESVARIFPKDSNERLTVRFDEIEELVFSGKDTAAGKSWERWVRTYVEKKQAGQSANLHPEWMVNENE